MIDVQAPMIPVVGEMVKRHPGTISLGQGVVHWGPPAAVAAAVAKGADEARTHRYSLAFGIDPLIESLSAKLRAENGIDVADGARKIVVTAGSNMGFVNAVLAAGSVGDEIILLSPFYFNHEMAVEMAGCRAVVVPTDGEYQPVVSRIEEAITRRTRAVVTVSPNNPTGAVYSSRAMREINQICARRGIYHVVDEAYEYFVYGNERKHGEAESPAWDAHHTICLYTFSKAQGMAGWRVGYMVIPAHLEEAVKKVQDTNLICPPVICQVAAEAALGVGRGWCDQRIAGLAGVRDLVLDELSKLGDRVHVPVPGGAFYALMKVNTSKKDMEIVEALIQRHGVAVMPGSTFGAGDGCYLRIAYGALNKDSVAEGMGRLVNGIKDLV